MHSSMRLSSRCASRYEVERSNQSFFFLSRRPRRFRVCSALQNGSQDGRKKQKAHVAIVGSGPAAHTAAIYLARAELEPVIFEGWMAAGLPPGGQLTTTTYVENFPGFPEPILGSDLCDRFRKQSLHHGALIYTETVNRLELREGPPFRLETDMRVVEADAVILATGAAARKLRSIKGYDQFWNNGISACAVCDGANPFLRNQPVAVIGGGDVAMEEAIFMARYASKVYIVHRFNYLEASKIMARRAAIHPKIEILWESEVVEAYGKEGLDGVKVRNKGTGEVSDLPVAGLFFGIGHAPATKFLEGQVELDEGGYIVTPPGRTSTSVPGVFAAGDVQDRKWRQAITAAGTGCKAAMEAEWYLQSQALDGAAGSTALTTGPQQLNAAWVAELRRQQAGLQQQGGVLVEDKAA